MAESGAAATRWPEEREIRLPDNLAAKLEKIAGPIAEAPKPLLKRLQFINVAE